MAKPSFITRFGARIGRTTFVTAAVTGMAVIAVPAGVASAQNQFGDDDLIQVETEAKTDAADIIEQGVDEGFVQLKDPALRLEPATGAVDITEIDIPVEVEPEPTATRSLGTGHASYYGQRFHGRRTANGERFNMNAMTAAHKTLPFGTMVEVTNPRNGKSVVVRINDRGPFIRGRTIDLSRGAAQKVGIVSRGHGPVQLALVES